MRTGRKGDGRRRLLPRELLMSAQCETAVKTLAGDLLGLFNRWPSPSVAVYVTALLSLLLATAVPARAAGLDVAVVAPGIYALVGDLGQRSADNLGNNATFGAVVTAAGVVLIDSGGSRAGAERIEAALRQVTDKPVVLVVNTGGQDHRWLGNAWFKAKGATVIASAAAVEDQRARADLQFEMARGLLGAAFAGTQAVHADQAIVAETRLEVGGVTFVLRPVGPAHTPGDMLVWLPGAGVAFSGDVVYLDRLLGVMPYSQAKGWLAAFETLAALAPRVVVPGHGRPAGLAKARAETFDYLAHLRREVGRLLADGGDMQASAGIDQSAFLHLTGAKDLAGRNAQQVFSEMEFE